MDHIKTKEISGELSFVKMQGLELIIFLTSLGLGVAHTFVQPQFSPEGDLINLPPPEFSGGEERIQTGRIVKNPPSYIVGLKYAGGDNFCTATLITPWRILTAAHCTTPSTRGRVMQAVLGLSDIRTLNVNRNRNNPNVSVHDFVYEDVVNGRWVGNADGNVNDIAIIKLKKPVSSKFKPITLASNDFKFRRNLKGMGWGLHNCTETSQAALREADGTYVDLKACSYWKRENIPASMVCMIYSVGNTPAAVASGDSGGPIISHAFPNEPVQIGIASYVSGTIVPGGVCVDKLTPQVYTRVSSHTQFIQKLAPKAKFAR